MNKSIEVLKSAINSGILDGGATLVTRESIRLYGKNDWKSINKALADWESRGILKILKNPETANDDDICIEMLHYIDRRGFDNWPPGNKSTDPIR